VQPVTCGKCGYEWEYGGVSDYYCTCPSCKTSVNLQEQPEGAGASGTAGLENRVAAVEEEVDALHESEQKPMEGTADWIEGLEGETRRLESRVNEYVDRLEGVEDATTEVASALRELVEHCGGEVNWESEVLDERDRDPAAEIEAVASAAEEEW